MQFLTKFEKIKLMFLEITPNFSLREWKCSETKAAKIYCWVMAQVATGCAASNQVAVHDSGFQLESCVHIYTVQLTICILKSDLCKIQLVPYHPRYKFCISQGVLVQTLLNCSKHLVKHSAITTIITTLPSYGQFSERWIFFLTCKQLVIISIVVAEVTIIPTYDTDTLGYWVAENEDTLAKYKIDLSPSASRCTINLQDHETSCSAYRLEFWTHCLFPPSLSLHGKNLKW